MKNKIIAIVIVLISLYLFYTDGGLVELTQWNSGELIGANIVKLVLFALIAWLLYKVFKVKGE